MSSNKKITEELLGYAGIKIDGNNPWDIQVKNDGFYKRVLSEGKLGLGESYMDGWWECKSIDQFIDKLIRAGLEKKAGASGKIIFNAIMARIFNQQRRGKAYEVGKKHYDIGNDLFQYMLDKRMNYSCGYWRDANNLDDAQEAKLDLICKKLMLTPGMRLLDIGCGWGSLAKFAAEKYGVSVVGITVSKEQLQLAQENTKEYPVEIRLQDYRKLDEKFDRIVSVGMFEHVGYKNYRQYFKVASRCLKNDGLFLLHTIAGSVSVKNVDAWTGKYIFPNGMLPSAKQITKAYEKLFILEDWHNFGHDYDKTLMAWHDNFIKSWDKIKDNYDERFKRMWVYYLLVCAGAFRAHKLQLWQIVFSKTGSTINYKSLR